MQLPLEVLPQKKHGASDVCWGQASCQNFSVIPVQLQRVHFQFLFLPGVPELKSSVATAIILFLTEKQATGQDCSLDEELDGKASIYP